MENFGVPKRLYAIGDKKAVTWRIPKRLLLRVDQLAKENGWTVSDVIITLLDQALQSVDQKEAGKKEAV